MEKLLKSLSRSIRRLMVNKNERFLIVVSGCTGTGKSDLGVEIAKKFNGEVISSDSMQIYKGLDIATNKVTEAEMQSIPHHMMSFYDPRESDYNVHRFRDEALRIINRIWSDNKLPIIVGGTSYYVESLLYENYLIASDTTKKDDLRHWLETNYSNDDDLYELLKSVDPDSASQVHRNNRYRVLRALEIFYATGKRKSEHLQEQRLAMGFSKLFKPRRNKKFGGKLRFPNTFLLNLDAEKEVLDERLDKRVDKMVERGLRVELEQFYDQFGIPIDNFGVAQSIGLKEFLPYLALDAEERRGPTGEKRFRDGCYKLKTHTRQYCRKQRNWLHQRILLRSESREIPECLSLNTSRDFFAKVVPLALRVVENFLTLRDPLDGLRDYAALCCVLMPLPANAAETCRRLAADNYQHAANLIHHCTECGIEVQGEKGWRDHLRGKRHRQAKTAAAAAAEMRSKAADENRVNEKGLKQKENVMSRNY